MGSQEVAESKIKAEWRLDRPGKKSEFSRRNMCLGASESLNWDSRNLESGAPVVGALDWAHLDGESLRLLLSPSSKPGLSKLLLIWSERLLSHSFDLLESMLRRSRRSLKPWKKRSKSHSFRSCWSLNSELRTLFLLLSLACFWVLSHNIQTKKKEKKE